MDICLVESSHISKYRISDRSNFDISKYRKIPYVEISNFRYIEMSNIDTSYRPRRHSIPRHPRTFYAYTGRKLSMYVAHIEIVYLGFYLVVFRCRIELDFSRPISITKCVHDFSCCAPTIFVLCRLRSRLASRRAGDGAHRELERGKLGPDRIGDVIVASAASHI